jgi:alkanesulfonate monooxygenase SsuD/methylene tetrahydromethanopterin reductase-like flavin-dependent oxidoreductase (luciferase family)
MLTAYMQSASAATRAAMSEHGRPEDFARAMSRLARGEAPEDAIDDRLLAEYVVAGTPEECLAQAAVYAEVGVTELAIAPIGETPADDIARLGSAIE